MHICFIADANSIHTRRWIVPLLEIGYRVSLISYAPVRQAIEWAETLDLTAINNTSVVRFLLWSRPIRQYLSDTKPDILHAHQISAAGWLGYLSGYHPFVVTAWGSDILVAPEQSKLHRILTGRVLSRCDVMTVPSKLMYEKALKLGFPEERLKLIPWGVEIDVLQSKSIDRVEVRKRFGIEPDAKVLLCPRGINRIYNIDVAIQAFKAVLEEVPSSRLVIVQKSVDDDYYQELLDLIRMLELEHFIYWLPQQDSLEEMACLYQMSDILISIPASEGYGFTVFEALASGCPTLITELPVFEGVLINEVHTLKVPVRDVRATSQGLLRLMGDNDLRSRIQKNGLSFSTNETVENRVRLADQIYRTLVGNTI